ncbi:uncharacterized protein BCR38DRAFT_189851 [Pseudomassariella vexata]|uniref:Uncharacterized protein n=1 Tax=Pseudomassariella vexata TaxID=1141098 RepID=A0A1Y2E0I3_9PEZI|nr:uncharacterized protein BCR38DRAFT_189851 [Pseudomassariella vexata]ORY65042.1 hypothetical protein BCR38DRAFT_189851 [Pseudomassariella vexata]
MPVIELAFLPLSTASPSPSFRALAEECIQVQDVWCASHLPSVPNGLEPRGVGMFQQIANSAANDSNAAGTKATTMLLTAHWASVSEHESWIASEENQTYFPQLREYVVLDRVRYFHVEGVEMFSSDHSTLSFSSFPENGGRLVPVLNSPVIFMERWLVDKAKKGEAERLLGEMKGVRDEIVRPHAHSGGWRIKRDDLVEELRENKEEYVFEGCESVEGFEKRQKMRNSEKYAETTMTAMLSYNVKFYKRFL